jgi:hypothetical protein
MTHSSMHGVRRTIPLLGTAMLVAASVQAQNAEQRGPLDAMAFEVPVAPRPVALKARFSLAAQSIDVLPQDTLRQRRRSVSHSEWYGRRLTIHRYGSYVMVPLFVAQYLLGSKLLDQKTDLYEGRRTTPVDANLRDTHRTVAIGVGGLFLVNTTTGLWNLLETRHEPEGRAHRNVHALAMLASDAGFAYTGVLGARATDHGLPESRTHRNVALTSFGIATAGAAYMWFGRED